MEFSVTNPLFYGGAIDAAAASAAAAVTLSKD